MRCRVDNLYRHFGQSEFVRQSVDLYPLQQKSRQTSILHVDRTEFVSLFAFFNNLWFSKQFWHTDRPATMTNPKISVTPPVMVHENNAQKHLTDVENVEIGCFRFVEL